MLLDFVQTIPSFDDDDNNTCAYFECNDFNALNISSPSDFSIYYMNARSLCGHFFSIQEFLATLEHPFSIYGFTETRFKGDPPPYVHMNDYQLVHSSRSLRPGGGVAMFVHNSLNFRLREDLMPSQADFEAIFMEIQRVDACNLIVGNVYRAPGTSFDNFDSSFDSCLDNITKERKLCYIMGDFNLNLLNCADHQPTDGFVNTFFSYGFRPLITKPTRITPHTATLIDNILTNALASKISAGILYLHISDHYPLFQFTSSCLRDSTPPQEIYTTRDINTDSLFSFKSDLSSVDWSNVYNENDANVAYDSFLSTFSALYNHHFPRVVKTAGNSKRNQPWITQSIINSCLFKNRLYRRFLRNPSETNERNYKIFRNRLTATIRVAKKNFYARKLDLQKGNLKSFWREINGILGKQKKTSLPENFTFDGDNLISHPASISDSFNSFFTNIGSSLASKIPPTNTHFSDTMHDPNASSFFLSPTDITEVMRVGRSMKSSSSCGFDDISSVVIKYVLDTIAGPLTHVFNRSFLSGSVPLNLKVAKIIPIFKNGDKHCINNYRPISILSSFSKILERLVYNRQNFSLALTFSMIISTALELATPPIWQSLNLSIALQTHSAKECAPSVSSLIFLKPLIP